MITILYDDRCGLCEFEITRYARYGEQVQIRFLGISRSGAELDRLGLSEQDALMAMHAIDEDGTAVKGADAFVAIWSRLPGFWPWLAKLVSFPPVLFCGRLVYALFARIRFQSYAHCRITRTQSS